MNEPTAEETDDTENPGSGGEIIEDETVPLAPGAEGRGRDHWALVNLICAVVTVVTAVGMVVTYFRKKDDDDDGNGGETAAEGSGLPQDEEEKDEQKRRKSKFLGLIPGVGSVIAFLLTEDMRLPMQLTDKWTVLMIIIAVVGIILAIATKNKKKDDEDREDRAEAMA